MKRYYLCKCCLWTSHGIIEGQSQRDKWIGLKDVALKTEVERVRQRDAEREIWRE